MTKHVHFTALVLYHKRVFITILLPSINIIECRMFQYSDTKELLRINFADDAV